MTQSQNNTGLPDPQLDAQFYAGVPFKRFLAWIIDVIIVLILCLIPIIFSFGVLVFFMFPIGFTINIVYRIFTINQASATLGMRMTGIELRNPEGNRFDLGEAVWHTALFALISMTGIGMIINMIVMMIAERGQGIHDLFLGTTAINRPLD